VLKYSKRVLARKERLVPSFIIIGGARAGTTSLYAYLISHPNVLPAARKETVFFNYTYYPNLDWYRMYFPTASEQEKMKKQRGQKMMITGEATPSNDSFILSGSFFIACSKGNFSIPDKTL